MVVASCSGSVFSFQRSNGRLLWSHDLHTGFHAEPVVDGTTYIVPVDDGTVAAFEVPTGAKLWQRKVGPPGRLSGLLAAPGGVVGACHGVPFSLSTATGAFRTGEAAVLDQGTVAHLPATADGLAAFVTPSGVVEAFEVETGEKAWMADLAAAPSSSVVAAEAGFLLATENQKLVLLDRRTGALLAAADLPDVILGGPVTADGLLIATTRLGSLLALQIETGRIAWQRTDHHWVSPRLSAAGGDVLAGSRDGLLVGLDPATGRSRWERQLRGVMKGFTRSGDEIYAGNEEGTLFALRLPSSD